MLSITLPLNWRWPVRGIRDGTARVQAGALSPRATGTLLLMRLLWAAVLVLPAFRAEASVLFTNLHSFGIFTNGANPYAGLVRGSDGNFYGTTYYGGTNGPFGTVFKISIHGELTTLHSFTGGDDGAIPYAALVQGGDGYLYGTTYSGGTNGQGTVFKISTNGALTGLHSFNGTNEGRYPQAGLVQGSDGIFYGTTSNGGTNGWGTVFKISTNGALSTLHSFPSDGDLFHDGGSPEAGLVQGSDGSLYGTTYHGGTNGWSIEGPETYGYGTVFKIGTGGALTTLYEFTGGSDGANPEAALVLGSDGDLYGTTYGGGPYGWGTVFKITTNGALTSLHVFDIDSVSFDGGNPEAGLVQGSDGSLYGTGFAGTVFKITTNGVLTTLHSFKGSIIGYPVGGLAQGSDGYLYGTTSGNIAGYDFGSDDSVIKLDNGTVFKISTNGELTTLYSFPGGDSSAPNGLVQGRDGSFYGTTYGDPNNPLFDAGSVFKMSTNGALTTLYSFAAIGDGGANPKAGLVQGSDGSFYGTTYCGPGGGGTVYRVSTNGVLRWLHSFTGTNDGGNPQAALVEGSDGDFYGTTEYGGTNGGHGTVFKIGPNGALTTLYAFTGTNDGTQPVAGLVQGGDGNFYGTTPGPDQYAWAPFGTIFKITPNGVLTTLYSFAFTGGKEGEYPEAALVLGSDASFYGTTEEGGTSGNGTVFQLTPSGALTTLYSFTSGNDGGTPQAALVEGSDGNFYGTTSYGGTPYQGTVFQVTPSGALTTLYSFTGGNDGGNPQAALVQGSDGSFYGTTYSGGLGGYGTVFRLTIVRAAPVVQAATLSGGTLSLTWSTEAGGTYQLQSNFDLSSTNWTSLGSPVTATGTTLGAIDLPTSVPRRFYRVALLP